MGIFRYQTTEPKPKQKHNQRGGPIGAGYPEEEVAAAASVEEEAVGAEVALVASGDVADEDEGVKTLSPFDSFPPSAWRA